MTNLSLNDDNPQPRPEAEPHAYDRRVRPISMHERPLEETLVLLARLWATTFPLATIETRQELAARIATELAGR